MTDAERQDLETRLAATELALGLALHALAATAPGRLEAAEQVLLDWRDGLPDSASPETERLRRIAVLALEILGSSELPFEEHLPA